MINALSFIACALGMVASWLCARGNLKAVYLLSIVNGFIFTALNAALALSAPGQAGVALMIIPSLWMIVTAIGGLWRLNSQEK